MKKRTIVIITILVLIILFVILLGVMINGMLTPKKSSFEIKMYGAEVELDGTIIRNLEFTISGDIAFQNNNPPSILLDPVVLYDNTVLSMEYRCPLFDDIYADSYYASWLSFLPSEKRYAAVQMFLNKNMDSCFFIVSPTRYYIGSIDPDFDPKTILQQFDYLPFTSD